ncbi:tetratricopeptide repeat-containing sensor histidine kinase [Pedobacter punctiformis]|uniref:histidine kinase n=1 Tax=Pedobacter punctiformis TaxID=3004097 RepID=A0ABT4LD76_9SPHI|nr:ATP-binding protein [Pedobacter sp. HCMS5-2]MCZ4245855.1 hypothetical protein [Pedobacter sp. HCMS5-2]
MKNTLLLIVFCIIFQVNKGLCQINKEFYNALPDSLKPKNIDKLSVLEASSLLNRALSFSESNFAQLDIIEAELRKNVELAQNRGIKIKGYYALAMYNFNMFKGDSISAAYNKKLISLIGKDFTGFEKEIFNAHLLNSNFFISSDNYESAIDEINVALKIAPKVKDKKVIPSVYKTLAHVNQILHLYPSAIDNLKMAEKLSVHSSDSYQSFDFAYLPISISDNYIRLYFLEKNKKYLDTASKILTNLKKTKVLTGRWLADWYVIQGYILYANNHYPEALAYADSSLAINFKKEDLTPIKAKKIALKGLILTKLGKKKEALVLLNERKNLPDNFFLTELVLKELYNTNKSLGNFKIANENLEEYLDFVDKQNTIHYRGIVFSTNQKYKVQENKAIISKMKLESEEKRRKNRTIFIVLMSGLTLFLLFIYYRNKINKIKFELKEKAYSQKIFLMSDKIAQHDELIKTEIAKAELKERILIAQDLHDDLSGSLVALQYLIQDMSDRSPSSHEKEALNIVSDEVKTIYNETKIFTKTLSNNKNTSNASQYDIDIYLNKISKYFNDLGLIKINTSYDPVLIKKHFTPIISENIYFILKECLTNIIKHAAARNVFLKLRFFDTYMTLTINDDGNGYTPDNKEGMGINNLSSRIADRLNGTLTIAGSDEGTEVNVNIPLVK